MSRSNFREQCVERDGGQCLVPWCESEVTADPDGPGEVHHIIERRLWPDGGYVPRNGASVCNEHHRLAETNDIPPQAFWRWIGIRNPVVPGDMHDGPRDGNIHIDKWGEPFETPPHADLRDYHKYPSTRHMLPCYWQSSRGTAEQRTHRDDTGFQSLESFLDVPLVCTIKMDGSNTMLVADEDEPVRARNGRAADHVSFDRLKQAYWERNVYENLPSYLQVFGENMYAKHSIHYGCPYDECGGCSERNRSEAVADVFLVFGVYDTRFDLWLSWPEVQDVADEIGFPTIPTYGSSRPLTFEDEQDFIEVATNTGEHVVDEGEEGIVIRSYLPFHYGQFEEKVGKYVRPNHVQTDEHWSHQEVTRNGIQNEDT